MQRQTWTDLATFAAIADAGSFTRAAAALGVSPSALSHALRTLETRLGVRLLNRSTRSVAPTQAGERLLAQLRPALADLDGVLDGLEEDRTRTRGRVRVSAHWTAATFTIMPRLPRLAAEHPDVEVELAIEDGLVDIVARGFDVGVRHEHVLERDMISVRIDDPHPVVLAAAPAYLQGRDPPRAPSDLLTHRCLRYRMTSSGALHPWRFERGDRTATLDPPPAFVSNAPDTLLTAAIAGMGIAALSADHAAGPIADGRLTALLTDWNWTVPANYLYYANRRHMSGALRAFIDAMRRPPE